MTRLAIERWFRWIVLGFVCFGAVVGCQEAHFQMPDRWQTYQNPRYGFEFLYPEGWLASIPPENRDGIAFNDPRNPLVEIRGWASFISTAPQQRKKAVSHSAQLSSRQANFTTEQGFSGNLRVQIDPKISSLNLTVTRGSIQYRWRGIAPSQQFDDYYRFFYFVASRYRVPMKS